jgi:formylglycine-generating enzyme
MKILVFFAFACAVIGLVSCDQNADSARFARLPSRIHGLKTMYLIKEGEFRIGDPDSRFEDEKPAKDLSVSRFYMDETPITYADFRQYVESGGMKPAYWNDSTYHRANQPVTGISWHQAADFCNWRSRTEGLRAAYKITSDLDSWGYPIWEIDSLSNGYRLPTEAEFEYAARGGLEQKQFPWGDEFMDHLANYDTEKGQMSGNWWRLTGVKAQKANQFGLYGMSGNIWHWCQDWYDPKFYEKMPSQDPINTQNGRCKSLRGGGWGSISSDYLRNAKRNFSAPGNYNFDIGFRCVRSVYEPFTDTLLARQHVKVGENLIYPNLFENRKGLALDPRNDEFTRRLAHYLNDYFPHSIYFQQKVDEQLILTPYQLAQLIVEVCDNHQIHPLFLTSIMVAESGMGTCSFPRWFNNPMAYRWQNRLMPRGLPTYEDKPNVQNRKFKTLRDGFDAFCLGIRKKVYYDASVNDLYAFHKVYVGYESYEWLNAISRVYRDVLQMRMDANFPAKDLGKWVYLDWKTSGMSEEKESKKKIEKKPIQPQNEPQPKKTIKPQILENRPPVPVTGRYYLIYGSYGSLSDAQIAVSQLQKQGLDTAKVLPFGNRFRISIADAATANEAQAQLKRLADTYKNVWIWAK